MSEGYTDATMAALANLRSSANFEWYLVVLLAFVIYVHARDPFDTLPKP